MSKRGLALLTVLITLIVSLVVLIFSFFFNTGEKNSWICVQNKWVANGHPPTPEPPNPCGRTR